MIKEVLNLEIDLDEERSDDGETSKVSNKYKDRKLDHRLAKYEAIVKKVEKINRVEGDSEYLFVGNCGLENNVSYEFLNETFSEFGKVVDIIMQKRKSYAFIIYENKESSRLAIEKLQSKVITCNQTPICFYIFPVDGVPDISLDNDYKPVDKLPNGLVYLENFIDETYASELVEFLNKHDDLSKDLKKRRVKHFGYEFRYGTNDCDENKPLAEPEQQIPAVCNKLIEKILGENLIKSAPDQMTVNFYEPGHGIPPHIDNVNAFDDYIISLSLCSSVQMEFRQLETKKSAKLTLEPNSLLVLKGDSRYKWSHLISDRKHDLILNKDNCLKVRKREKRISLTFRKIKRKDDEETKSVETNDIQMKLPENESEAKEFEKSYVHTIYNEIADHFSHTRHSAWPGVAKFIDAMEPYSAMCDIGCGNGKYLNLRKDLVSFGCDYSDQLIEICQSRNFNCFVSDCLRVPCKTDYFDYVISIAVIHHLSTKERRVKAIKEMCRVLKPGGRGLVTVWAKEQKYKNKESYYISQKSAQTKQKADENENPLVHKFGREFEKKDLFVAWHYNAKTMKKTSETTNSETEKQKEEKVYLRFYHVFENQELEDLFQEISEAKLIESYYEQGNWCAIFKKE